MKNRYFISNIKNRHIRHTLFSTQKAILQFQNKYVCLLVRFTDINANMKNRYFISNIKNRHIRHTLFSTQKAILQFQNKYVCLLVRFTDIN